MAAMAASCFCTASYFVTKVSISVGSLKTLTFTPAAAFVFIHSPESVVTLNKRIIG